MKFFPLFYAGIIFYHLKTGAKKPLVSYILVLICLVSQGIQYLRDPYFGISITQYVLVLSTYFTLFILFVHDRLAWVVSRPTIFFGKISFALYLVHQHVSVDHILPYTISILGLDFWIASLFIALPFNIAVAYTITSFIEFPIAMRLRTILNKKVA